MMNKNDIENLIRDEFTAETPDIKARVMERASSERPASAVATGGGASDNIGLRRKRYSFSKIAVVAAMLVFVFAVGLVLGNIINISPIASPDTASIYLDVNPSIELVINEAEYVTECKAGNSDAEKVLLGLNLNGVEINTAIKAIIGSMYMNGYINSESNSFLVSADSDSDKFSGLLKSIVNEVNTIMSGANLSCTIVARNVEKNEQVSEQAGNYQISPGKMSLVNKIVEKLDDYDEEDIAELVGMSIRDLNLMYTSIPEDDIDYEDIAPDDDEDMPERPSRDDIFSGDFPEYIDKEDALEMVAEHLDIDEADLIKCRVYAKTNGFGESYKMIYNVSFEYNGKNYSYEVDCKTGEITEIIHSENGAHGENKNPPETSPDGGHGGDGTGTQSPGKNEQNKGESRHAFPEENEVLSGGVHVPPDQNGRQ